MDCSPSLYLADRWNRFTGTKSGTLSTPLQVGRRFWIIGASDGIGKELAMQLARNGEAKELILSSRSDDKLRAIQRDILALNLTQDGSGCSVSVLPMDVCETKSMDEAMTILKDQKRIIDTVVLNAGAGSLSFVEDESPTNMEQMMKVNALYSMMMVPRLLQDKEMFPLPHFVVTASIASVMPVPLSASYAASKHAILGYFRTLQAELPKTRVHIFLPGPINTNFHKTTQNESCSQMKQGKERCAELMRRGMKWSSSKEFYIAQQPLLFLLYLNHVLPSFLMSMIYQRVGPKRRSIWQQGLDLYDPKSWRS